MLVSFCECIDTSALPTEDRRVYPGAKEIGIVSHWMEMLELKLCPLEEQLRTLNHGVALLSAGVVSVCFFPLKLVHNKYILRVM